jgi:4-carboxymuconolactone decarboxylase
VDLTELSPPGGGHGPELMRAVVEGGVAVPEHPLAELAPKLVSLNNEVLFGDVWERPGLSKRDRSLITVSVLVSLYRTEQMGFHLNLAMENGLSRDELVEAMTHLAFYAGWPNAMTGLTQLKALLEQN